MLWYAFVPVIGIVCIYIVHRSLLIIDPYLICSLLSKTFHYGALDRSADSLFQLPIE